MIEGEDISRSEELERMDMHEAEGNMSGDESMGVESPFFPEPESPEGMSTDQISNFPTMLWGAMHQRFNGGEKCSVCLE